MFEDLLKEKGPKYSDKSLSDEEFKVLFCTICSLYKDCKFAALKECIKEWQETV